MNKNKETARDVILIIVGAIIGLCSGLTTSKISNIWNYEEKTKLVANNLRGNIQYELTNNSALYRIISEDIDSRKGEKAHFDNLKWKHSDILISSIGSDIGFLKSDVIKLYVHYFGMLKQLQNSRDLLINSSISALNRKERRQYVIYYLKSLEALEKAGKDLLNALDIYYSEG